MPLSESLGPIYREILARLKLKPMNHLLVIDVGTSSLKVMLYESTGRLVNRVSAGYHSEFFGENHVEQDALTWKRALLSALAESAEVVRARNMSIDSIAVTSQRASVIPVDDQGQPLDHAIMWQDKRSQTQCGKLLKQLSLKEIYRRTGLRVDCYFSAPKIMWLRDERPDIYAKAHKLIGIQDYIVYLLTGVFMTDWTQACRSLFMNISTFSWDEDMLVAAGIPKSKLPELCPPGTAPGVLTHSMGAATGLASGIPVVICGGDQQCAALALNILQPGDAAVNSGTGSFVTAHAKEPLFDHECRTLCSASAVAGKWIVEAGIYNTGSIYDWFNDQFYSTGQNTFDLIDEEASRSPVGANGVMMLPHFEGSAAPYWNPLAKGLFYNLTLGTVRGDFSRAILEGIALEIAHNLTLIECVVKDISQVSVAGGLVALDLFNQIQADAFNKAVIRYDNCEASSLGALMSAAVQLGIYQDHTEAFRAVCPSRPIVFKPDIDNVVKYRRLFELKKDLYQALWGYSKQG
jgi:glycerol kinase